MSAEIKQYQRGLLDTAMTLLTRVQIGNMNEKVERKLDVITEDLDELIVEEYGDTLLTK